MSGNFEIRQGASVGAGRRVFEMFTGEKFTYRLQRCRYLAGTFVKIEHDIWHSYHSVCCFVELDDIFQAIQRPIRHYRRDDSSSRVWRWPAPPPSRNSRQSNRLLVIKVWHYISKAIGTIPNPVQVRLQSVLVLGEIDKK